MPDEIVLASKPADAANLEAEAGQETCPRCAQPLVDPHGLGWCKGCGYCRSLEMEKGNQLLQAAPEPSRGAVLAGAAGNVPLWLWLLLGGLVVLAGMSLTAGRLLPPGNNLTRALWTTAQIGAGWALAFVGQLVALVRIAPEDEKLSFKDALVPTRLWGLVFKRLPRLSGCLCISTWGVALALFAGLFIGGLPHWLTYLPGAKNSPTAKVSR